MKVIKKGEKRKWEREYFCTGMGNSGRGCSSLLLVEEDDLFTTQSSTYDGSVYYYTTFRCPECRAATDIDKEDVPSWVKVRSKE